MAGKDLDPLRVNSRLYKQIAKVLDDLEHHSDELTMRDRIAALTAVARIQTVFVGLRKEHKDDDNAGSAVRKYAGAFAAKNASRRRAATARAAVEPEPEQFDWGDDDGGDAA